MILKIDIAILSLVLCLNAIGFWMTRSKVRVWAVPINTLLCIISMAFATAWGCMLYGFTLNSVITYGLPNGIICWLGATASYDFCHEYVKRKDEWLSVWKAFIGLFKKKEVKA